ncbi:unnamed protein product [Hermetia illucens]|uniref:palmitoyl-CoA hydrolase n=1 Tax=Hermetia illucens TaxID=343691 RepID=A0A7R8YTV5_HERIL|nr:lysosomal thioesterase PPT2 homolog [Hermetia illucens]CAD7085447.1 unnamed protein product [Hermetia illucens]
MGITFQLCVLAFLLTFAGYSAGFKPVVLLHGILSGSENMVSLGQEIEREHPDTKVYNCDKFSGWNSLESAWRQIKEIGEYLMTICKLHPEGVHLIGYSQGGLLARAILQSFPDHNVKTFISLSAPQAGQYGTSFLHLIFPDLMAKTAFELFYSRVGQHTSVGNYWNDPYKQELYYEYSTFLPYVNNEIMSANSSNFKEGLLKLKRMILVGGPNDGVITPWQSSHFGYFNGSLDVIPLEERPIFTTDAIGLKTLSDDGRLVLVTVPHVNHFQWHRRKSLIRKYILPHLD